MLGLISVFAAIFGLLQGALTSLTMEGLDGNYTPVNSAFLVLACVLAVYPVWLGTVAHLRNSGK